MTEYRLKYVITYLFTTMSMSPLSIMLFAFQRGRPCSRSRRSSAALNAASASREDATGLCAAAMSDAVGEEAGEKSMAVGESVAGGGGGDVAAKDEEAEAEAEAEAERDEGSGFRGLRVCAPAARSPWARSGLGRRRGRGLFQDRYTFCSAFMSVHDLAESERSMPRRFVSR